ncbi:MAG: TonB-dependent receptor [Candidatus Pacebacteria bacterium]|nr:TonB-dependent receptor [Candidatus Paceibacterota bacterium]
MKKEIILLSSMLFAGFSSFAQQKQDTLRMVRLQEVQVVSTRATGKTPMAYSTVSKSEIKKQNFGQDIPFLLSLTPSLVATSDAGTGVGYTGFRVRGSDASRVNVTTNGIPLNDSESHGVYWVNMPDFASSVEDLQIQRGVGSSTNGAGAFGATLNMKTENISAKSYAEVNGSYGSFNTSKATFKVGSGLINNHWAFDARLSNIHSDGFVDRATSDLHSYFMQGGYFSGSTVVKLIAFGGKEKTYHAWYGAPKDSLNTNRTYNPAGDMGNGKFYDNQTDNYTQNHFQLILTHVFNPNLNLNAALHYTKGFGYYEEYKDSTSEANNGKALENYGLKSFDYNGNTISIRDRIQQKWLDNDFGGVVFSLNYKNDQLSATIGGGANRYVGNSFGKNMWVKDYFVVDPNYTYGQEYYRSKGDKVDANIYTKVTYQIIGGLSAYADLQYRYIDYTIKGLNDKFDWNTMGMQTLDIHKTFNFFNPKAGLFYQINKNSQAYASVAVGHREPTRSNYTDAVNSQTPTSEQLVDYEAGYTFANETFTVGANLYFMNYINQLILTGKINDVGEALTTNIPESYRAGVELMAGVKFTNWLKWDGNVTFSKNEIKNFTEFVDDWTNWPAQVTTQLETTPIAFSPNVVANSIFTANYQKLDVALQSNFVGKQYIDNSGNESRMLNKYLVNNLRLGYTFNPKGFKSIGLSLLVNNIFNAKYESNAWVYSYYEEGVRKQLDGYFPQAGTNVLANLSFKF